MSHVNNAPCMSSILIPSPSAFQSKKRWTQRVDTIHQGGVKGPQDSKTTWQTMSVLLDFRCEVYEGVESWCIVYTRTLYLIFDIRNKIVTMFPPQLPDWLYLELFWKMESVSPSHAQHLEANMPPRSMFSSSSATFKKLPASLSTPVETPILDLDSTATRTTTPRSG